jgi:hypothetical protein
MALNNPDALEGTQMVKRAMRRSHGDTEDRQWAIGSRQQAIGNRQQAIGNRQQAIGNRQPGAAAGRRAPGS